jgi:hypothetical protein
MDVRNFEKSLKPGMVAQLCNPSYSGNEDEENPGLRPTQTKG